MDEPLRRLGALASTLGPALRPVGHDELLRSITEVARRMFDAAACSIALLDATGEHLEYMFASGTAAERAERLRIPASQGIAGWAVTTGQPIEVSDVSSDPRFARDAAEATGYIPRSLLAMPLEGSDGIIGVLSILDRSETRGGPDMTLLGLFGRQAAVAIEHGRAFAELGHALLDAMARTGADDDGLSDALRRTAAALDGPPAELAGLAAALEDLWRAGEPERRAAQRILEVFADYVRARR